LLNAQSFTFGELTVERSDAGAIVRSPHAASTTKLDGDPETVRRWARFDDSGDYRPLAGAKSLRPGFAVNVPDDAALEEVLDAVYPLARLHADQLRAGALRTVPLAPVLGRQTGRYAVAATLSVAGQEAATSALCARCVKTPAWNGAPARPATIPCPEPCSVLVSLCRDAAIWEKAMPPAAPLDPAAPFADFEAPGNPIREDCLSRLRAAGEARIG
jgi:sirohydrochlorin cobaltochelatase